MLRRNIKIKVCAAWDTVASLGLPLSRRRSVLDKITNYARDMPENIDNAFHALALNELRSSFKPVLWNGQSPFLKQCWFLGTHGEVGGDDERSAKAYISLAWMISQLRGFADFDLLGIPRFKNEVKDEKSLLARVFSYILSLTGKTVRDPTQYKQQKQTVHFSASGSYLEQCIDVEERDDFEVGRLKQWKEHWQNEAEKMDGTPDAKQRLESLVDEIGKTLNQESANVREG